MDHEFEEADVEEELFDIVEAGCGCCRLLEGFVVEDVSVVVVLDDAGEEEVVLVVVAVLDVAVEEVVLAEVFLTSSERKQIF